MLMSAIRKLASREDNERGVHARPVGGHRGQNSLFSSMNQTDGLQKLFPQEWYF